VYRSWFESSEVSKLKPDDYSTIDLVLNAAMSVKWIKDGPRQLFDAIGSPERFQYLLNSSKDAESGNDCDEFAVWCHVIMNRVMELGHLSFKVAPIVLTVTWTEGCKIQGHNVCVYQREDGEWYHIGNWGLRGSFNSFSSSVEDVLQGRPLLKWAVWTYPGDLRDYDVVLRDMKGT